VFVTAGGSAATANGGWPGDDRGTAGSVVQALSGQHPRNVIFLLGDGMGTQEITAARYYLGVRNKLNVDRMPLTGFDTTWSVKPAAAPPYKPDENIAFPVSCPDRAGTG
jgi:alkaline phosphatase